MTLRRWSLVVGVFALCLESALAQALPALATAAEQEDWNRVRELVDHKSARFTAPDLDGTTALHWAAYHDRPDMVETLLNYQLKPNAVNRFGVTPLFLACENGNAKIVEFLLKAGADPQTKAPGGATVLMTAARTGKPDAVKKLISAGAKVRAKDPKGQTALMMAAAEGHAETVKLLLKHGANAGASVSSGFTPWFFAVRNGRIEVVRVLLEGGGVNDVIKPKSPGGRNPRTGTSALLLATENGHFELGKVLLEAGADPNDQRSEFTALHALSWVRKPDSGDDPKGDPSPIGSGSVGSLEFAQILVEHGADVNARLLKNPSRFRNRKLSLKGATPFLMAARTADLPLIRTLQRLGADSSLGNEDGATALMAAAGVGCFAPTEEAGTEAEIVETLKHLIMIGGDVNCVDRKGETAMHGAAYKSLPKVVLLLAEEKADIEIWNQKNSSGWTPLIIAQGFRPGNFKPSAPTITAIEKVMRANGIDPPKAPKRR